MTWFCYFFATSEQVLVAGISPKTVCKFTERAKGVPHTYITNKFDNYHFENFQTNFYFQLCPLYKVSPAQMHYANEIIIFKYSTKPAACSFAILCLTS